MPGTAKLRIDTREFFGYTRRAKRNLPATTQIALDELATIAFSIALRHTDRKGVDTGRFRNGIAQIITQIGVKSEMLIPLRPSKILAKNEDVFEEQLNRISDIENWYTKTLDKWERIARRPGKKSSDESKKIVRGLKKDLSAIRREKKAALREFERFESAPDHAIVIFGRRFDDLGKNMPRKFRWRERRYGAKRVTRILGDVYGGSVRKGERDGEHFLLYEHKEPHARIVEKRHRSIRRGLAEGFNAAGLRRVSGRVIKELESGGRLN